MRFTLKLATLTVEDDENPHGGAICGSLVDARKMQEILNTRNIIKSITSERDCRASAVLEILRGGVL